VRDTVAQGVAVSEGAHVVAAGTYNG